MKKISLLVVALVWATFSFTQDESKTKLPLEINVGVGFPNTTHTAIDGASSLLSTFGGLTTNGDDNGSSTPFFNVSGIYKPIENIGIGAYLGYFESTSAIISSANLIGLDAGVIGDAKYTVFSIGGKLEVHQDLFPDMEKLDTYASTYLGYNFVNDDLELQVSNNETINSLANSLLSTTNFPPITYEVNGGIKYAISDNTSIFGEAGIGRFLLNMGVSFRP